MAVTYLSTTGSTTNTTTYTFSSQGIGSASANRYVIIGITSRTLSGTGGNITSLTVGGISCTINSEIANSGNVTCIGIANVPTGTTADVVATFDETQTQCDIAIWTATDVISTTASDTLTSTAADPSGTIDVTAGGFIVAIAKDDTGTAPPAATWTELVEDFDALDANGNNKTGAHKEYVGASSGLTIGVTWVGTGVRNCFSAAAFAVSSTSIKTINGLAQASVKTINGLAIASVKNFNGLA